MKKVEPSGDDPIDPVKSRVDGGNHQPNSGHMSSPSLNEALGALSLQHYCPDVQSCSGSGDLKITALEFTATNARCSPQFKPFAETQT